MFIFYILFSPTRNRYYTGHTGDKIEERLRRHNSNHKGFTGNAADWKVVYTELYKTKEEAYRREREVKALKSRVKIEILPKDFLLVRLLNAEMSDPSASSGKTTQAMSRELRAGQTNINSSKDC